MKVRCKIPCYQVNTISIEFRPENRALLEKAVATLGWTIQGNIITTKTGTITLEGGKATGRPDEVNLLRVTYSKLAVEQAQQWAKSKGWQTQKQGNKVIVQKGRV